MRDAVSVKAVVELDDLQGVCYEHMWGCFVVEDRIIYLLKSLDLKTKECVLTHELKHADGYNHPDLPNYAIDCGTGEFWIAPLTRGNYGSGTIRATKE